jgi:hypothetical protein
MQLLCTPTTASDQLAHLEQVHRSLPPLQDILARWQHAGASTGSEALALRERRLGAATLSGASLRLLYDIASQYVDNLPGRLCWHAPTLSAWETQSVLPLCCFRAILRQYAARAYAPAFPWIELAPQDLLPDELAQAASHANRKEHDDENTDTRTRG